MVMYTELIKKRNTKFDLEFQKNWWNYEYLITPHKVKKSQKLWFLLKHKRGKNRCVYCKMSAKKKKKKKGSEGRVETNAKIENCLWQFILSSLKMTNFAL